MEIPPPELPEPYKKGNNHLHVLVYTLLAIYTFLIENGKVIRDKINTCTCRRNFYLEKGIITIIMTCTVATYTLLRTALGFFSLHPGTHIHIMYMYLAKQGSLAFLCVLILYLLYVDTPPKENLFLFKRMNSKYKSLNFKLKFVFIAVVFVILSIIST